MSPIFFRIVGIDFILGMDWMKQHRAMVQCKEKVVTLTTLKGDSVGVSNKHQLVNLYLLRVRPGWCTKGHKA